MPVKRYFLRVVGIALIRDDGELIFDDPRIRLSALDQRLPSQRF